MDCTPAESQINLKTPLDTKLSPFRQKIEEGEKAYFMFQRNKKNKPKNKKYFDHIDARTIKMRIEDINDNGNNYSKNILKLGFYTIDFHENFIFQDLNPTNSDEHYEFGEESSSRREYRSDQSRFTTNIAKASLKTGNDGTIWCKLGEDWWEKNNE